MCTNTVGNFTCTCLSGYVGDGVTICDGKLVVRKVGDAWLTIILFYCTDIDECASGTDNCDANAVCTNTHGNFTCICLSGYSGDGVTCNGTYLQ